MISVVQTDSDPSSGHQMYIKCSAFDRRQHCSQLGRPKAPIASRALYDVPSQGGFCRSVAPESFYEVRSPRRRKGTIVHTDYGKINCFVESDITLMRDRQINAVVISPMGELFTGDIVVGHGTAKRCPSSLINGNCRV